MALQRLQEAAEKAKIELCQVTETTINLPFITATAEGPLHIEQKLTRSEFERMTEDLVGAMPRAVRAGDRGLGQGRPSRSTT